MAAPQPGAFHEEALKKLYRHLRPDLANKPWPAAEYGQQPPERRWPPENGMCILYRRWWKKVYITGSDPTWRRRWTRVERYIVAPLRARPLLVCVLCSLRSRGRRTSCTPPWAGNNKRNLNLSRDWPFPTRCAIFRSAALVGRFLGNSVGEAGSFRVTPSEIKLEGPTPTARSRAS